MIITQCAACAKPLAYDAPRCVRCHTRAGSAPPNDAETLRRHRQWHRLYENGLRGQLRTAVHRADRRREPRAQGRPGGDGRRRRRPRLLHRQRGARALDDAPGQLPDPPRSSGELGQHGAALAAVPLQVPPVRARGALRPADGAAFEYSGEPRAHGRDHVRDVQRPGHVRQHPGRPLALRVGPHDGLRPRLGRRRLAHGAHLRGLRAPARHRAPRPRGPRPHGLHDEDPHGARLLVHDDGRARDRPRHQGEAHVHRARLRPGDEDGRGVVRAREVVRAPRRQRHRHRQRALPLPRGPLPAVVHRQGGVGHPRLHVPDHHEVRRRHPQGPLLQHRPLGGHDHVPRHRRAHDQGAHGARAVDDEDQGRRAARAQVLGLDRRLDPLVALDVPVHVDLQGGVRRVGPGHRPPQVLLDELRRRCRVGSEMAGTRVEAAELPRHAYTSLTRRASRRTGHLPFAP
mmetsp:Transcript_17140/g.52081  ORF Transcript_17140/g.52081 Transcript_17140/m.52081 type:complete len:458 (-) Transcript_17140:233-1606(-)